MNCSIFRLFFKRIQSESLLKRSIVVMTGIQPTGIVHIGNYLGPIRECKNIVKNAEVERLYISIVDLHCLTVPLINSIQEDVYRITATLLASGLNEDKVVLFQQSSVAEHANLAWILMCLCPLSKVQSMPQWREKSAGTGQQQCGLLMYPVLQAADILLYGPHCVPVGDDQTVHLELALYLRRTLLRAGVPDSALHQVIPEPRMIRCSVSKVQSLKRERVKMSKSDPDPNSRIEITDPDEVIRHKISRAITDSEPRHVTFDPEKRPALANLIVVLAALKNVSTETVVAEFLGQPDGKVRLKQSLASALIEELAPIRSEVTQMMRDKVILNRVLCRGQERAQETAQRTLRAITAHLDLPGPSVPR